MPRTPRYVEYLAQGLTALGISACISAGNVATPTSGAGQETVAMSLLLDSAQSAVRANQRANAVAYLRRAERHSPGHPALLLELARQLAVQRDTAGTLATLDSLTAHGLRADPAQDSLLDAFSSHPAFGPLARRLRAASQPRIRSDTSFRILEPGLGFEGMTHAVHPNGDTAFYVGAMRDGMARILRVDARTKTATALTPPMQGSFMGMKVDRTGRLWAVHTFRVAPTAPGGQPSLRRGELVVFDIASGALRGQYPVRDTTRQHWLNDLTLLPDGRVLVTDYEEHRVYEWRPGDTELRAFAGPLADFTQPNGIDVSPDGQRVYVSHFEGISVIDPRTGRRAKMSHPPSLAIGNQDGLYACGRHLLGIQDISDYNRVILYRLDRAGNAVVDAEILEQNRPEYFNPSTGTIVGDSFHYIGARTLRPDGRLRTDSSSALMLRLPLEKRCQS